MSSPAVRISGHGMEVTDAITSYITEKLTKYERIFEVATSIEVVCSENLSARGVDKDFAVEIVMTLPKEHIRVEKDGADLYAIIDEITDVLSRKVKRYKEKREGWEGAAPWKDAGAKDGSAAIRLDENIVHYSPKFVERKTVEDSRPMSEEEAVERMETLGDTSYLFKNAKSGRYSMVYRKREGEYVIVEPPEE